MSAAQHTPGPWHAEGPDEMFGDYNIHEPAVRAAVGAVVSNLRPPEEVAANARLIAAAPEMLAELKALAAFWSEDGSSPDEPYWTDDMAARWRGLRAVIAKAECEA